MEFTIAHWDNNEDGWLEGSQHTTLDCALSGNSSWLGSLYAAALLASEKMALLQDDNQHAKRCRKIHDAAIALHNDKLWNGQYYFQMPGEKPNADYNNGCSIDQMLGQWWAWQVGLGDIYPHERVRSAMSSLFKHNFNGNFTGIKQKPREFVKSDEAAMQIITWPGDDRPSRHTAYADEVMSGFEYAAASTMLRTGLTKEALTSLKAVSERYDGRLRTSYKPGWGNLGYSGNPFGDDECGKFYSRSLSIYSVLLLSQGYHYNGPERTLSFKPVFQPDDHKSFFTTANGWGLFTQNFDNNIQTNLIDVRWGKLDLKKLILNFPEMKNVSNAAIYIDNKHVKSYLIKNSLGSIEIIFGQDLSVSFNQSLRIVLSLD